MTRCILCFALVAVLHGYGTTAHAAPIYSYTDISVAGVTTTTPMKINDNGVIVGFVQGGVAGDQGGFILKDGGYQIISSVAGVLPSVVEDGNPDLRDVNNAGVVIGNYLSSDISGIPSSVSAMGVRQPFILAGSTYSTFKVPNAWQASVYGINDRGQIAGVGSGLDGPSYFGFIRDPDGTFTEFSLPPGCTNLFDINNSGDMASYKDFSQNAIIHSDGTYTTLSLEGFGTSLFYGLNDYGDIVGGTTDVPYRGFVYLASSGEVSQLTTTLGSITLATGINSHGQIVGTYVDSQGQTRGYLASPLPSPVPEIDPNSLGSVLALVLGSLGLLERRRLKAA
jgi:hypothetical protein